jgi:CTP synthase (UTP-ammonia lyase)
VGAVRIALLGDYNPNGKAHQGAPRALALAGESAGVAVEWEWVHTSTLQPDPRHQLDAFQGVWCVPGSPYANTAGVIAAIRHVRTAGRPFLGTCGGFQHAMLECAEVLWGVESPAHAEVDPQAVNPVIASLSCSLVEKQGDVFFVAGSRLAGFYGVPSAVEGYHCSYGLNANYAAHLESGPLRVSARDVAGEVRAAELDGHPFFFGTLYQPERSGLDGCRHPLIAAFVSAASRAGR